ncbi:TIR-like protein FxsC [Verrucosispora sp. WMMD573]|uniref:TIR-like protein FxsC n=1 Tax=Verrucosispora sp. WMMD573 TaxID=3015149 RepID=UPI00248C2886|nr:TIR-like protein FxsC [Verrucosispora sp. WMMD573]WBB56676.1 TIR-like protein FxsC [Verrucosispora sp. WMMD573]
MLYFFLSYARGDEDALVQRFYEELSAEVRLIAGLSRDEKVGFVDRTMQVGERWPQRLVEALGSCRSFLALMTPRYFQSRPCGQEWQFFAERTARFENQRQVDTSLLKPLMWIPAQPGRIHPVAQPLQYSSDSFGDPYQRLGVRQLMRLQRHSDDYRTFLFELANQIVSSVEAHPLPEHRRPVELQAVESAFHARQTANGALRLTATDGDAESMLVHFVIATSDREEMRDVREHLTVYGDDPLQWSPYRPPMREPLVEYAREIAAEHSYRSTVVEVEELSRSADLAARYNQILVLIVDAWLTRLPQRRQALIEQAAVALSGQQTAAAILIPSSREDPETREHWQALSRACREIFGGYTSDDELYWSNIFTHRAFEELLSQVLEVARNRLLKRSWAHRPIDSSMDTSPPRLDGPWVRDENNAEREDQRDEQ